MSDKFGSDFRRFFLRGLAAMLPTLITLMILIYVVTFVDQYIGKYINVGVQWVVVQLTCLFTHTPTSLKGPGALWTPLKEQWVRYHLDWLGFLLAFVAIYVFGRFVASYIGRSLWKMIEQTLFRIPIIRQIYPHVKQVTDFLLTERRLGVSRVVAVEYPRKGIWSLGLATGAGMRAISKRVGADLVTVFIPSSPTPVTGYTITVRRDEVIDLPMTIDEALKFTVTGGVIMPLSQLGGLDSPQIDRSRPAQPERANKKESAE